jgi:glycosyltransferase involved in cell wall biosynthesis
VKPLVSILIPAYNAAKYLPYTLQSAIAQDWPSKEIIVIDDGSRDETLEVARRFSSESVSVFTQDNQGAASTRNNLLAAAQGDFIQWLDADDLLAPQKISSQLQALKSAAEGSRVLASGPWGYFYYRTQRTKFRSSPLWCDLSPAEWLIRKMEHNAHMQTATWLVGRELTEEAGPWNSTLLSDDDGEYFARVILRSSGIRFVPEAKVFYRRSDDGRLSYIGDSPRKIEAQFASMRQNVDYVLGLDDGPRARNACVNYLQAWLPTFHPERPDIVREARDLASLLGGALETPRLPWKYFWVERLFGRSLARRAQFMCPRLKANVIRAGDRAMLACQNGLAACARRVMASHRIPKQSKWGVKELSEPSERTGSKAE